MHYTALWAIDEQPGWIAARNRPKADARLAYEKQPQKNLIRFPLLTVG